MRGKPSKIQFFLSFHSLARINIELLQKKKVFASESGRSNEHGRASAQREIAVNLWHVRTTRQSFQSFIIQFHAAAAAAGRVNG